LIEKEGLYLKGEALFVFIARDKVLDLRNGKTIENPFNLDELYNETFGGNNDQK
jgi:hypothetical protein